MSKSGSAGAHLFLTDATTDRSMASTSAFWHRTPPALFPATLGMFGISLAWNNATSILGVPPWAANLWMAVTSLTFAFIFGCYILKVARRPAVILQDMSPLPGRAAVSAGSMCLMMCGAGLNAVWGLALPASAIWLIGFGLHIVYMLCVMYVLAKSPPAQRTVTPVLFLPFVGYIVSPIGGVPLGFGEWLWPVYLYTLAAGSVIVILSTPPFLRAPTPVPARPSAAILLAPTSVAAISAHALGWDAPVPWFIAASILVASFLLFRIRWLTAGGWTPLWGAFTFPAAALAGALLLAAQMWGGLWVIPAWAVLIAASFIIAPIWVMTLNAWSLGRLAPATGAQTA